MRWIWMPFSLVATTVCAAQTDSTSSLVSTPSVSITTKAVPAESWPAVVSAFQESLITGMRNGRTFLEVRTANDANGRAIEGLGLANRDVLHSIDGIAVFSREMAIALLREVRPGKELRIVAFRGNKRCIVALNIDSAVEPTRPDHSGTPLSPPRTDARNAEGADVMVLSEAALEKEWADIDPYVLLLQSGLRFVRDASGSVIGVTSARFSEIAVSSRLGLKNHDIILSVNGMPIHSEQAIFEIAEKLDGEKNFAARIRRDGREVTLRYRVE
ncbi:MAG: hypothetical protein AMXMBFR4_12880 [Candidatus Hydrogenedentota bacterium]